VHYGGRGTLGRVVQSLFRCDLERRPLSGRCLLRPPWHTASISVNGPLALAGRILFCTSRTVIRPTHFAFGKVCQAVLLSSYGNQTAYRDDERCTARKHEGLCA
jgi:hypothetical protein